MPPRSAYVHVPFCHRRCGYCNFTVTAQRDDLIPRYLNALAREMERLGPPREVDTLFFGGGTPTYLPPRDLRRLLESVKQRLTPAEGYEWSVEANPEDIGGDKLDILADGGVNRISLGIQSFNDRKLEALERGHRGAQARQAVVTCRERFPSVAADLIFAAPGETLSDWQRDLSIAIDCGCDHISTYGLTYEKGAPFWARLQRGQVTQATENLEREMYEAAIDTLTDAGYEHYEVSNFSRPGHRCRHNLTYWQGDEYYAFGPGAARFVGGWREMNHRSTTTYLKRLESGQSPAAERERLDSRSQTIERLVFQLRMMDGVDIEAFEQRSGFSIAQLAGQPIDEFTKMGFFERSGGRLRLSRAGLLVSDSIWGYLLSDE